MMTGATTSATCRWGAEMKVITSYVCPPIPYRGNDWCAYFDKYDGNEDAPRGWGASKLAALENLLEQLDDDEADAKAVWDRINDIDRQW